MIRNPLPISSSYYWIPVDTKLLFLFGKNTKSIFNFHIFMTFKFVKTDLLCYYKSDSFHDEIKKIQYITLKKCHDTSESSTFLRQICHFYQQTRHIV